MMLTVSDAGAVVSPELVKPMVGTEMLTPRLP